jgi:hypothetical protein
MRKKSIFAFLGFLFSVIQLSPSFAQTVNIDVDFALTPYVDSMNKPLGPLDKLTGVPVRVILGESPGWQDPDAGHRFVTDSTGQARFTTKGIVDRRWKSVNVGMTGLSIPKRSDHMRIAVELEQLIPTAGGKYDRFQWLHLMDIDCISGDNCSTSDFTGIYTRDANGRFTRRADYSNDGLKLPELGGMVLGGPGYKVADFFLSTTDPAKKTWQLKLVLQRMPAPVMR